MDFTKTALELVKLSPLIRVFPLIDGQKIPRIKGYTKSATRDPHKLREWGEKWPHANVGISTDQLLVIDVDNKNGKHGSDEILKLETEGKLLPPTLTQKTPSGGYHYFYALSNGSKARSGVNVFGDGIDVRGRGGYVVGPGSVIGAKRYRLHAAAHDIVTAPEWVEQSVLLPYEESQGDFTRPTAAAQSPVADIEPSRLAERASRYLLEDAPIAIEGEGGDETTYKVFCQLKDIGCDLEQALELANDIWNPLCEPPWEMDELRRKAENAYNYGRNQIASAAPEAHFADELTLDETKEVEGPIAELNKTYAYIGEGMSAVAFTSVDSSGRPLVKVQSLPDFHNDLAPKKIYFSGRFHQLSKVWLAHPDRRSFKGLGFYPEQEAPEGYYNVWHGFAVEEKTREEVSEKGKKAVDDWLLHAKENICANDEKLDSWLIRWLAHIVQKPYEKPLTALVLKGRKGVGKNAFVERVGELLGTCAMVVTDQRYLTGNFNSHLENKLLLILDEAFWSGDKKTSGILKGLITGADHVIERKGFEPYRVSNLCRVVILGNEDWLVPASEDERRYAVFDVGEAHMQNTKFFQHMRVGLQKEGGLSYLLKYLRSMDLTDFDPNVAPKTKALLAQKEQSLTPFLEWWMDCLESETLVGEEFEGGWPREIRSSVLQSSLSRYFKIRNISARAPKAGDIVKRIKKVTKLETFHRRIDGVFTRMYRLPSLAQARKDWSKFIGHEVEWEEVKEEIAEDVNGLI